MTVKWRDTFVDLVFDLATRRNQTPDEKYHRLIDDTVLHMWQQATFWDKLDRYEPVERPNVTDFYELWDRAKEQTRESQA